MAKMKNEKTSKVAQSNKSSGALATDIEVETTNVRPPTPTEAAVAEVKESAEEVPSHQVAKTDSSVQDNQSTGEAADGGELTNTMPSNGEAEMTNVRPVTATQKLVADLKELAKDDRDRSFDIGDLVEVATSKHKMKVGDLIDAVGLSRQRLCDCRMTAVAFLGKSRRNDVPFHFFTLAARAAKKFRIDPVKAIETVYQEKLQTVREVSCHFAKMGQKKETGKALENAALLVASNGELLDRCHHDDFRTVIARLNPGTVKLAIADPSYDGKRKSTTSATMRGIDGDSALETQESITELLKRLADKMSKGGTLALFRPGAALDPAWLSEAIASAGWQCDWALTWNKNKAKPGRTDAPYGIASERILILSREGEKLTIHDDSSRDDILEFKPIQPHHTDADPYHQHQKPLELMRYLIGKHTCEAELVIEPFGGTGSACQAAVELNRHWLYCETVKKHFDVATVRIDAALKALLKTAS